MQGLDLAFHLKDFKARPCPSKISQEAKALDSRAHALGIARWKRGFYRNLSYVQESFSQFHPAPAEGGSAKPWDLGTIGEVIGRATQSRPRSTIKAQVSADFLVRWTTTQEKEERVPQPEEGAEASSHSMLMLHLKRVEEVNNLFLVHPAFGKGTPNLMKA